MLRRRDASSSAAPALGTGFMPSGQPRTEREGRLIAVSNRVSLPVAGAAPGGLALALGEALGARGGTWIGWSGNLVEDAGAAEFDLSEANDVSYGLLDLEADAFKGFYEGYANGVLWPVFHTRPDLCDHDASHFEAYRTINDTFARTVAAPGPDNPYFATHQDATLAFFKSFHGGLQLIADVKLKPVVGDAIETARPNLAESRLSGRALDNIAVNLAALEALYLGESGPGLSALVRDHGGDAELDPLMRKAFRMTLETARGIEGPLGEAVNDPARRPAVEKLTTQVLALKQIVKTRLAAALDLQVGFNALDGD